MSHLMTHTTCIRVETADSQLSYGKLKLSQRSCVWPPGLQNPSASKAPLCPQSQHLVPGSGCHHRAFDGSHMGCILYYSLWGRGWVRTDPFWSLGKHRGSDCLHTHAHTRSLSIIPIQTQRFFNLSHTLTSLSHIHAHSPCSSSHHTSVSKPSVTFEFCPSGMEVLLPMKSQHQSVNGFEDPLHFAHANKGDMSPSGQHFHSAFLKPIKQKVIDYCD